MNKNNVKKKFFLSENLKIGYQLLLVCDLWKLEVLSLFERRKLLSFDLFLFQIKKKILIIHNQIQSIKSIKSNQSKSQNPIKIKSKSIKI